MLTALTILGLCGLLAVLVLAFWVMANSDCPMSWLVIVDIGRGIGMVLLAILQVVCGDGPSSSL